jgi:NitT/TauT family transport system substrate-binding protein
LRTREPARMNRKTFALSTGAFAFAARRAAAAAAPVNVAIVPIDADAQFYYAEALGIFRKNGVDVNITSIAKGSAILAAVIGGSVDVGVANPISVIEAYKRGVDITCIAPSSFYSSRAPSTALIVKDPAIKSAHDLEGKTVAVNALKDLTQLSAMNWIDKNGGDSSKAKYVELGFAQMLPALQQGRIDAAVLAEPMLTMAKSSARILGTPYDTVAPVFPVGCFFATAAYLKQNAASVATLVETLREAGTWANKHQRESGDILARAAKMDAATLANTTRVVYSETPLQPSHLQPVIDLCAKYGVISGGFSASNIVWVPGAK